MSFQSQRSAPRISNLTRWTSQLNKESFKRCFCLDVIFSNRDPGPIIAQPCAPSHKNWKLAIYCPAFLPLLIYTHLKRNNFDNNNYFSLLSIQISVSSRFRPQHTPLDTVAKRRQSPGSKPLPLLSSPPLSPVCTALGPVSGVCLGSVPVNTAGIPHSSQPTS